MPKLPYEDFEQEFLQFVNMQTVQFGAHADRTDWRQLPLKELAGPFTQAYMDYGRCVAGNTKEICMPDLLKHAANLCNWVFIMTDAIAHAQETMEKDEILAQENEGREPVTDDQQKTD
jgi:hypothetical protein